MNCKISVCIPTYRRPDMLIECLESCLNQTSLPHEILIGDDSPDTSTRDAVRSYVESTKVKVRYFSNQPSLGQSLNVDSLFQKAEGDYVTLIHDDDLYHKNAFEIFQREVLKTGARLIYGQNTYITNDGEVLEYDTKHFNRKQFRTEKYEKAPISFFKAALIGQVAMNGYLLHREEAKEQRYAEAGEQFSDACDRGYFILMALKKPNLKTSYVNQPISYYRLSNESIDRSGNTDAPMSLYKYLSGLNVEGEQKKEVDFTLRRISLSAIRCAIRHGQRGLALKWTFGPYHRKKLMSPRGPLYLLEFTNPDKVMQFTRKLRRQ